MPLTMHMQQLKINFQARMRNTAEANELRKVKKKNKATIDRKTGEIEKIQKHSRRNQRRTIEHNADISNNQRSQRHVHEQPSSNAEDDQKKLSSNMKNSLNQALLATQPQPHSNQNDECRQRFAQAAQRVKQSRKRFSDSDENRSH